MATISQNTVFITKSIVMFFKSIVQKKSTSTLLKGKDAKEVGGDKKTQINISDRGISYGEATKLFSVRSSLKKLKSGGIQIRQGQRTSYVLPNPSS